MQSGRGRRRLAPLELGERVLRQRGREADLDHVAAAAQLDREAAVAEDVDHAVVVRQHLGGEDRDALLLRRGRELAEHDRRDAVALPARRRRRTPPRRARRSSADVGAVRDDLLSRAGRRDERVAVGVVDVDRPLRDPVDVRHAEEAQADRLQRERLEEGPHRRRRRSSCTGRTCKRRPVAQRDVDRALRRVPVRRASWPGASLDCGHADHCARIVAGAVATAPSARRPARTAAAIARRHCRSPRNVLTSADRGGADGAVPPAVASPIMLAAAIVNLNHPATTCTGASSRCRCRTSS